MLGQRFPFGAVTVDLDLPTPWSDEEVVEVHPGDLGVQDVGDLFAQLGACVGAVQRPHHISADGEQPLRQRVW